MTGAGGLEGGERFRRWLRASRANFLPVSILPYCLGAAYALRRGEFHLPLFFLGLAGAGAVLLAANLFNEYWDYRFSADRPAGERSPHYGGSGAIQEGTVSPRAVLTAAWSCLVFALLLGTVLALVLNNLLLLILVVSGSAIAWAYTAPPLRLVYRGGGETALWLAFGPLLTAGAYLLAAGSLSGAVLLLSLAPGFLVAALLTANEFGDTVDDARAGKRNLVVRAGPRRGFRLVILFLLLAFAIPPAGILAGVFPAGAFLFLPALAPAGLAAAALARGIRGESGFAAASRLMILTYNCFHLLLIAGIMIL